jgi:predicted aconitase
MISSEQQAMLDGARGEALQMAMRMLVAVGRSYGTQKLIPAASAHLGMSITTLGEAGVDMLERFAAGGARFVVPTTTNVLSLSRGDSTATEEGRQLQDRAQEAVRQMGAIASFSCNPFSQGHVPSFGQSVAWSESATAPYINSVLGARTNREGATALASALTGMTSRYGLHLDAERQATDLFHLDVPLNSLHEYHLLAAAVCRRSKGGVPAITGLGGPIAADKLYGFCAAYATYSNGAMFHLVGITPEAPSLTKLFPVGTPPAIHIGAMETRAELDRMRGCEPAQAELVVIGCPHASLAQLREVRDILGGRSVCSGKTILVHTNADIAAAAANEGTLIELQAAGVQVSSDTCIYVGLKRYAPGTILATDSAKMAFLMASRGLRTAVASTLECVSAVCAK